jgi:cytochrome c554/c'-like protein
LGGLSKKVFQINTISKHHNESPLLVDSGNLLFKRSRISKGPSQEKLKADSIVAIYQDLGYDAVGVGPLDLAAGIDFIQLSNKKDFPWVSANIIDTHGKPVFRQWINKELGNTKIAITAITAIPGNTFAGIIIEPWEEMLPAILAQIKQENNAAFVILLSTLSNEENIRIAKLFPSINILIGADVRKRNISPKLMNNCLITQTEKQGKYQGLLEINFGKQRQWGQDSEKQLADLQNKLGALNWQLSRLEKKTELAENNARHRATLTRLINEKQALSKQISSFKETISREKETGPFNDQYTYRFIGLSKKMPDDQATAAKLNLLNLAIRELNKKTKAMTRKRQNNSTSPISHNIVGYDVCTTCHLPQAKFWKSTRHAAAYETLLNIKKNLDLECLPCHLTLNTKDNALNHNSLEILLSLPAELQSVGCESCHGAGKNHSISPERFKLMRIPEKGICLTCHTPDHDDNFEYNRKLLQVSCPAG